MQGNSTFFIITHQPLTVKIPFPHRVIGVEGFTPDPSEGTAAAKVISRALDYETAFGGMRSLMAMNEELDSLPDSTQVFVGSYRLFLGRETQSDWLSPIMQENMIISPEQLATRWEELVATEIPDGVDMLIPAPRLLPDTVLGQYARVHHLDDLLFGVACAIRSGLLNPLSVPMMLSTPTLIPYGLFAARKNIRYEFNKRLWSCALEFYKHYHIPRFGYQRRAIDFVFERVVSMAIVQMITEKGLRCLSCRNIFVSASGKYEQSV
jgi:hypothetical protein